MAVACVEIGGTTAGVAVADGSGIIVWRPEAPRVATGLRDPETVVGEIAAQIKQSPVKFATIGIASFGPLEISKGCIGNTPKKVWRGFPLVAAFKRHFADCPVVLDTDVNAPAFSEYLHLKSTRPEPHVVAYITIGTGVGIGLVDKGKPYHGLLHPELGHIFVKKHPDDLAFEGSCPFHGDCLEGLIASGALAKRLNIAPEELPSVPNDDPVWEKFSFYLAQVAMTAALAYAIDYMFVGGGICTGEGRGFLVKNANVQLEKLLKGYVQQPVIELAHYQRDAGLVGAAALGLHPEAFQE